MKIFRFIVFLLLIIVVSISLPLSSQARAKHPIKYYQKIWCKKYQGTFSERLNDGTKCDCQTSEYVFKIDYSYNWKKSIGQALHYALQSGKRAGIVLILEKERERVYLKQLQMLVDYFQLPLDVWSIGDGKEKKK